MSAKRAPSGSGTRVEVRPGVWRIRVPAGYDSEGNRQRIDLTVRGPESLAASVQSRLVTDFSPQSPYVRPRDVPTLREHMEAWLDGMKPPTVREETWQGYDSKARLYILPELGQMRLDRLTPMRLDMWKRDLGRREARGGRTLSARSALAAYRVLHACLGQAVAWALIDRNPLDSVKAPRPGKARPESYTVDEARAIISRHRGHAIEPIVIAAFAAGLRRSEACGLHWEDVAEERVSVSRGLHQRSAAVWYEPPKTEDSARVRRLPRWALDRLLELRDAGGVRRVGPMVTDGDGPMAPNKVARLFKETVLAAGIRYLPLKNARHTYATVMLEAGADIRTVQGLLAHTTVTTTEVYTDPRVSFEAEAVAAFDALWSGPSTTPDPSRPKRKTAKG